MKLPPPDTPLYNHPLPTIEAWLRSKGCVQDEEDPTRWSVVYEGWSAEIMMDIEEIRVRYNRSGAMRAFPYSLSRRDVEDAIFTGP
ncbi:MAG: DUF3143 domain-containing protein [Pseudanabaenaceae cyanobacterium SKYGB_i_bin29]|nr:DUF3143 domain-containing protein [Pseudanabaenaceae cyanobacterium SKYG29]MDW8421467.1 DUF3143 domain-containing protein [Pseudanabaenaceae cyanobacterium SKYGB_i_bin29]